MRGSLGLRVAVVLLALAIAGAAGFLARDDWNWARPLVSWFVERETGPRAYFEVPLFRAFQIYRDAIARV